MLRKDRLRAIRVLQAQMELPPQLTTGREAELRLPARTRRHPYGGIGEQALDLHSRGRNITIQVQDAK